MKTGGSTLNTPYSAGLTGVYNAGIAYINMTGTTYGSITYYVIGQPKMYLASKSAGTWSGWNAVATNADIQAGEAVVTPTAANTPTPYTITFPHPFLAIPVVVVSINGTVPGTIVTGVSTQNITKTGFTVYVTRTNTTETGVRWIAVAR